MPETSKTTAIEALRVRFRSRLGTAIWLYRAYQFVVEVEPPVGEGPDLFSEAATVFRAFRRALRNHDVEGGLDSVERVAPLLEACRQRVLSRDALIEAYRVRWACENAPLHPQTINSLARLYRLLPVSTSSQSKYEYVLTRRLAGPIGPERKLAPTPDLLDAVMAFEAAWSAPALSAGEEEVDSIRHTLTFFAEEAASQPDAATFTTSALLRRFGAFKASLGQNLFDPRVSVAVVEANVRVLNVLNQLLADAGGQPLRGRRSAHDTLSIPRRVKARTAAPPRGATGETRRPTEVAAPPPPRPDHLTSEVDISGLEAIQELRRRAKADREAREAAEALEAEAGPAPAPLQDGPSSLEDLLPPTDLAAGAVPGIVEAEPPPPARPDLRTGEVDLSGLEFVRRLRLKVGAAASPESEEGGEGAEEEGAETPAAAESAANAEAGSGEAAAELEQQPSMRAFELGKFDENAAVIDRYLTGPRSPEVWQLDLDVFLGRSNGGVLNSETNAAERRRALELILSADDLICARATQDDAPTPEHRSQVRAVANAMLLLRTSLRRSADLAQGTPAELEPLLYVADHLLWERLRLEASLKRKPGRPRPLVLPRSNQAARAALEQARQRRRQRQILTRVVAVAAAVTTIAGLLSVAQTKTPVDPEVTLVQVSGLPGAGVFDDARAFRSTLFVTVSKTWTLLAAEERRSIMRGLGAFAAERGLDTVSVIGPGGEPWATFKDDEVILDGELTAVDLAKR